MDPLTDDRGKPIVMISPLAAPPDCSDRDVQRVLSAVHFSPLFLTWLRRRKVLCLAVCLSGMMSVIAAIIFLRLSPLLAALAANVICLVYWPSIWHWGVDRSAVVRAWGSISRCAACGYTLRGLHPEPDGCTTCPECGAAWRLR